MKHFLFNFAFLFSILVFGQNPGGIEGQNYWFQASKKDTVSSESNKVINFYSALTVNDQNIMDEINPSQKLEDATVFVVLKPAFLQEEYQLLDINSTDRQISIQSDRIKSKKELKIKNFNSPKPYFFSYLESYEEKSVADTIQSDSLSKNNYPSKFEGDVAEVIYYPKLLSKLERRKVETYLSLKYGISLPLNSDYINSKNDTIWKNDESRTFLHRVSGIGRDIAGNFNHKQSANVDDDQFLTIGLGDKIEAKNELNKKTLHDINYVLWADDFGDLSFLQEKQTPEVSLFNRTWKTKLIGEGVKSQNYIFSFDTDLMEGQNDEEEKNEVQKEKKSDSKEPELKYWLVFAPDTSGKLNINSSEFIQSVEIPKEGGRIEFSDIPFKNQTDSFLFSLVKAPELFALVETTEKNCQSDAHLKIIGGVAPYTVEFYSDENQKFPIIEKGENQFDVLNLTGGNYVCKITDAFDQTSEQDLVINSDTQGAFALEDIFLKEGESLAIDLNELQKNTISEIVWLKDDQEIGWGAKHTIREEGSYSINYQTEKGCPQVTPFVVTKIPAVEWSGVYPNPVRINEPFFVKLENASLSKVRITIADFSGRIIKSKLLKEGSEIYSDTFFHQGTYHLTAESQSEKFQYTLIVK